MAKKSKQSFEEVQKNLLQKRLEDIQICQRLLSEFWDLTIYDIQCLENSEIIEEPPF